MSPPPVSYLGLQLDQRYRLEQLVGEGASSLVFAARDLRLDREVAVKLLKPRSDAQQAAYRKRFVAEGQMLARLHHPHVVAVHDTGETADGLAYLVMELSQAGTLENELQRRGKLGLQETLELLLPIMGALACAHDRNIVHRDLKPANIVLVREGDGARAKLLDFGIAKQIEQDNHSTQSAIGTPAYMAPEQARGEAIGPQADVWALGVLFFRCLSGTLPLSGASPAVTLLKIVQERAPRFEQACPGLPATLAVTFDRALDPDLRRRYADMRSFARALALAACQDGVRLPPKPEPQGLPDFAKWLTEANLQSTAQLEAVREQAAIVTTAELLPVVPTPATPVPYSLPPALPIRPAREPASALTTGAGPRGPRRLLLAGVAAGALAAAGVSFLVLTRGGQTTPDVANAGRSPGQSRPLPSDKPDAAPIAPTPTLALPAPTGPLPATSLPEQPIAAPVSAPDAGEADKKQRRSRRHKSDVAAASQPASTAGQAASPPPSAPVAGKRKPSLVTSWEW